MDSRWEWFVLRSKIDLQPRRWQNAFNALSFSVEPPLIKLLLILCF
jgi:hypothetical protein